MLNCSIYGKDVKAIGIAFYQHSSSIICLYKEGIRMEDKVAIGDGVMNQNLISKRLLINSSTILSRVLEKDEQPRKDLQRERWRCGLILI